MERRIGSKEKFFWNMMGSFANALASVVLSICVNRLLGGASGGIFAFAYSNAQLMLTIGQFEVRQYQATDVTEKYRFRDYWNLRVVTCALMLVCTAGYIGWNRASLSWEAGMVVLLLSLYKMVEAYADVYGGYFQQKDRIDLSGKIFFIRVAVSSAVFVIAAGVTKNLVLASAALPVTSGLLFFLCDKRLPLPAKTGGERSVKEAGRLARDVFPLFLQAFSIMYINNAPKYAINRLCSPEIQNIYNILFMPIFAINLFSIFIFRPMLLDVAKQWEAGDTKRFGKTVGTVAGAIGLVTLVVLAGAWLLGIPVLTLLYGIDLSAYRGPFLLAMITGGIGAYGTLMYNVITAMRCHKRLIIGYGSAVLCAVAVSGPLVASYGILGGIMSYALSVSILAAAYSGIFFWGVRAKKKGLL